MHVTREFERSYLDLVSYPCNLICKSASQFALKRFKEHVDEVETILFRSSNADNDIRFLEPAPAGQQGFKEFTITNDDALRTHLGDRAVIDANRLTHTGDLVSKQDPKCRFVFVWPPNSLAQLKVTRQMLLRVLSYHQVMQDYLHFLTVFGQRKWAHGTRFSGFRSHNTFGNPSRGHALPDLGRSGRQCQLCYNLKSVACTSAVGISDSRRQWSIRQTAVLHQFDVEQGTTLWLITKAAVEYGALDIKDHISDLVGSNGRPQDKAFTTAAQCLESSLAVHLLITSWACQGWRQYLQWLEEMVETETKMALIGPRGFSDRQYMPEDVQIVQQYEEKANIVVTVLEGNIEVLDSLRAYYEELCQNRDFPLRNSCGAAITTFTTQLRDAANETKMQIARARLLLRIIADRKTLVLQHLQTQQTDRIELLTALAQKEAIAMRVITVVTLIFLPATFVSTFFSTDVVKYQNQNIGPDFSTLALYRWLQVTLPLMFVTLAGGWLGYVVTKKQLHAKMPFLAAIELRAFSSSKF